MRCESTRADGSPCRAPEPLIDPSTARCPAHAPDAKAKLSEAGKKGAAATNRKRWQRNGLDPEELPELETHAEAKLWLERIGRAVATGRLGERPAQAAIRAVSEWVKAHEGQLVSEDMEALRDRLEELESELSCAPLVRRVP